MSDKTPEQVIADALPPHDLMNRIPSVTSNPCNGVGCGCHPSTTTPEAERGQR